MKGAKVPDEVRDIAEKLHIVKKDKSNEWLAKYLRELSTASPTKQCCVGAAAGAVNGYIFGRVGKNAAVALGGSLILLQVASHMGYIKINWRAVENDLKEVKKELRQGRGFVTGAAEEAVAFLKDNLYLGGGFIGGFVLGLATA